LRCDKMYIYVMLCSSFEVIISLVVKNKKDR